MKNNLGLYKSSVEWMKKTGGPLAFLSLVMLGGYAIIRPLEAGGRKIISLHKKKNQAKVFEGEFLFTENGSYGKLQFLKKDSFHILLMDDDMALIEKVGDDNNPYIVAVDFLKDNSNFK